MSRPYSSWATSLPWQLCRDPRRITDFFFDFTKRCRFGGFVPVGPPFREGPHVAVKVPPRPPQKNAPFIIEKDAAIGLGAVGILYFESPKSKPISILALKLIKYAPHSGVNFYTIFVLLFPNLVFEIIVIKVLHHFGERTCNIAVRCLRSISIICSCIFQNFTQARKVLSQSFKIGFDPGSNS